ncbi:MAG: hypothetical protein ACFFHV_09625 [Promethearchaeota archaeon]
MSKNNIIFISTYAYLSNPEFFAITPYLKEFRKIYFNPNDGVAKEVDEFNKLHLNKENILKFFDIYIELKPIDLTVKRIWNKFRVIREYIKMIYTYLNKIKPEAVISCSDRTLSNKIIISWCKKKNIPFIIIQPAFIDSIFSKPLGFKHLFKYIVYNKIFRMPYSTRQNLFGNEDESSYLLLWSKYFSLNPKRKNMFFIGNPAFDNLFKQFSSKRTIKKNIIICTEIIDELFGRELFNMVNEIYLKAIESKPDFKFYIKLHPRDEMSKYVEVFNRNKFSNIEVVKVANLYDLFKLSDIQLSVNSFSSLEAVAMGLPIIIVNPNNLIPFNDYFREEVNLKAINKKEIPKKIEIALSDEYWQQFLKQREKYFNKMFFSIDGQSGKRAADLIKLLINKKSYKE